MGLASLFLASVEKLMLLVLKLFTSAWSQIIPSQFCHRRDVASRKPPKTVQSLLEDRERSLRGLGLHLPRHLKTLPRTNCKAKDGRVLTKGSVKPQGAAQDSPIAREKNGRQYLRTQNSWFTARQTHGDGLVKFWLAWRSKTPILWEKGLREKPGRLAPCTKSPAASPNKWWAS